MARNVVILVGRLAADPKLRYLSNGTPVANFAVAVNRTTRKADGGFNDELDGFFDCELFGGQALSLVETCAKGVEVQLVGSLRQNRFQTKGDQPRTISRMEIRVESVAAVLKVARAADGRDPAEEAPAPQPA